MNRLLYTVILFFIPCFLGSYTGKTTGNNLDYWELSFNEKILADGHDIRSSVSLTLDKKHLENGDTIRFYYQPCGRSDKKTHTILYFEGPGVKKTTVSAENSISSFEGKFSAVRLKEISNRYKSDSLDLYRVFDRNPAVLLARVKLQP